MTIAEVKELYKGKYADCQILIYMLILTVGLVIEMQRYYV